MHTNKLSRSACLIAPVLALGALLGGCDGEDHSTPDLGDVRTALHQLYGQCPLWRLGNVRRIDGAPNPNGYEVSYSFVLTLKNPDDLTGKGPNVSKDDAMHVAASVFGDTDDPCFYGVIPMNSANGNAAISEGRPLAIARSYQGTGDRVFVHSEQGWHLTASAPNPRDPSTYDQFAPLDDAAAAALQASSAEADAGASPGSDGGTSAEARKQSIFHRLNLMVMSLFHAGRSHPDETAGAPKPSADIAAASAGSEQTPADSSEGQEASGATVGDAASAVAPAAASDATATTAAVPAASQSAETPSDASPVAAPPVPASAVSLAQGSAASDQAALASQAQAAKLQLLVQKAQDEFNNAQYKATVATAEAILLLDPSSTQAQQLRSRALRLEQEVEAKAQPPVNALTPPPPLTLAPAPQPASRMLVLADLEGDWHGTYQCGSYSGSGSTPDPDAWTHRVRLVIRNGQAQLIRQSHGEHPYREVLAGDVANDLSLHLTGTGQYVDAQHAWTGDFIGHFAGSTEQPTFVADGALTNWRGEKTRTCHLALGR